MFKLKAVSAAGVTEIGEFMSYRVARYWQKHLTLVAGGGYDFVVEV